GAILSIEDQRAPGVLFRPTSATALSAHAAQPVVPPVPIEPGTLSVRAFVTIVYAID
ncbi:MAG: hypothetical protein JO368_02960, partial [Acidimicrobiales bacterium]|nr:hypothetical protein [Acidimicrobiales bacterium]